MVLTFRQSGHAPARLGLVAVVATVGIATGVAWMPATAFASGASERVARGGEGGGDSTAAIQDSTPPDTVLDLGPARPDATPTFEFHSTEPGSSFQCRLDDAPWHSCQSPRTYYALPEGTHTFQVRAIDVAGNVDPTPARWRFDSPPPRTRVWLFCDLVPGGEGSYPFDFTDVNGTLFFSASIGNALWSSDGTCGGTQSVHPYYVGAPRYLTSFRNRVFFQAPSPTQTEENVELWSSDGTKTGTRVFADIARIYGSNPMFLTVAGDTLFFHAWDPDHGDALWATDGTRGGTRLVGDVYAQELADFQGTLYFAGWTWENGMELWRSDGTASGTHLVRDIWPGRGQSNFPNKSEPSSLVSVDGTLYFAANDGVHGRELWKSDGTAAGTRMVCDLWPGSTGSAPQWLAGLGGRVYFAASDSAHGLELWRSDGTCRGTKLVRDIVRGQAGSGPREMTRVAKHLFFAATDDSHGAELWVSDGTGAGTKIARDIIPGRVGSGPDSLAAFGRRLFFAAADGIHGKEIWNATP